LVQATNQRKELKGKLVIWRTKMQAKVQDQKKWQIKAKLTLHHFGRKFNWFKPQTKEKSSNKRKLMIWRTKMQAKVQTQGFVLLQNYVPIGVPIGLLYYLRV